MNSVKILSPSLAPPAPLPLDSRNLGNVLPFLRGELVEGFISRQIDPHHYVMRIQGQEFNTESQNPLPTGTKVSLRVEETGPRVVLRLVTGGETAGRETLSLSSTSESALPLNARSLGNALPFLRGEMVEGLILRQVDSHHLVIRVQGQELNAETEIPLPIGTKVSLRVEEVAPQVVLKLATGGEATGPEILSFIKKALPFDLPLDQLANRVASLRSSPEGKMPAKIQEALNLLSDLINRFSLPLPSNPETIQELILSSGLFWETRLKGAVEEGKAGELKNRVRGDIKGVLSLLKQELEQATTAETGEIGRRRETGDLLNGVDSYLRKIEFYQLLNASSPEDAQRFHFILPFMFGQDFCFGELHLSLPEEGAGDSSKGESSLTFLLSWPEGGNVRIDVKIREERIVGQFQTNDPKWKALLEEGMEELTAKLQSLGLQALLQVAAEPLDPAEKPIAGGIEEKIPDLLSILV